MRKQSKADSCQRNIKQLERAKKKKNEGGKETGKSGMAITNAKQEQERSECIKPVGDSKKRGKVEEE